MAQVQIDCGVFTDGNADEALRAALALISFISVAYPQCTPTVMAL